MNSTLTIDGSEGEGGGQIVRTSMALSVITGTPVKLIRIRAGRSSPGLKRQHLTAVRAACEISNGELIGAELGADQLQFVPRKICPGTYRFSVGSAGSAMLVLQTILPPLMTASEPSVLHLEGGTHNEWAPPFDFLQKTYLPLISRMGPQVTARLDRHGFYPAGDGRVEVRIQPSNTLKGFRLLNTGAMISRRITALLADLPEHIGEREVSRALRKLDWNSSEGQIRCVRSAGPGNVLTAELKCESLTAVFTSFGRPQRRAEKVADNLVAQVSQWQTTGAPVDEYLADQLLLPLALSAADDRLPTWQRGGSFRTGPLSLHARTHCDLLQRFLNTRITTTDTEGCVTVDVTPA